MGDGASRPRFALPLDVPGLAALDESSDAPVRSALEDLADAVVPGNEEHVAHFRLERRRRPSLPLADETVPLATDLVGDLRRQPVDADVPVQLCRRERNPGR